MKSTTLSNQFLQVANIVHGLFSSRIRILSKWQSISGVWALAQQQGQTNTMEIRSVLLAFQSFKKLLLSKVSFMLATENTTIVVYLTVRAVDTHCQTVFLLWKEILLLYLQVNIHLVVCRVPLTSNIIADCPSWSLYIVKTDWELLQLVFNSIILGWNHPIMDLLTTSWNHKLETFVYPEIHYQTLWLTLRDGLNVSVLEGNIRVHNFPSIQISSSVSSRDQTARSFWLRQFGQGKHVSRSAGSIACKTFCNFIWNETYRLNSKGKLYITIQGLFILVPGKGLIES